MSLQQKKHKDIVFKCMLYIASVLLVVLFIRDNKFSYIFQQEKPWRYAQLIATFDFPIYKNEELIKQERDSLLKTFSPYFNKDKQIEENQIKKLQASFNYNFLENSGHRYMQHIENELQKIYDTGIISKEDKERLTEENIQNIRIIDDKQQAIQRNISQVFTPKDAYEYLIHSDTIRYSKTFLQQSNLNLYITSNLVYDEKKSQAAKEDMLAGISEAQGMVLSGEKIIDRGEIISKNTYDKLISYQKELLKRNDTTGQHWLTILGRVLFIGILFGYFFIYLEMYRRNYYTSKRNVLLLIFLMIIFPIITSLITMHNQPAIVYMLPFTIVPIIVRVFMDSRTAFMIHIIVVMTCSVVLNNPNEFILLQVVAGLAGIYSLNELSQRSQLFQTAFYITLAYSAFYFAYELIIESDLSKINYRMYIYFLINGILLLFTYPLLFVIEKTFGFTSNVTLVELSNINHPLLRKLSEDAPGTFQHTMQVANLAAAAANKIGANSQLVRTGALYHDIGKIGNPVFFTENQNGVNPHKNLTYEQSAQIIINHVIYGLKLADKYNLPKIVRDFISTHHGSGKTKYFYISYKNEHPNEPVDESLFTYPGHNPSTPEQAILMMADSTEAASHSLTEYTEENINNLVDKIIDAQVSEGFFTQCPVTFKDITTIKTLFKDKLKAAYHTRISYPELKK